MAFVRKTLLQHTQLTTGNQTLYTSPSNTRTQVSKATACNTTANSVFLTIYIVPSGGSAGATNEIYDSFEVEPNATAELFELRHVLEAGDFIVGKDDTGSAVNIRLSGTQIT